MTEQFENRFHTIREIMDDASISRRNALRTTAGAGLAGIAAVVGIQSTSAAGSSALQNRLTRSLQEGTPMAVPAVGPQDDGTNLWRVVIGGMDMENEIEYHAFSRAKSRSMRAIRSGSPMRCRCSIR